MIFNKERLIASTSQTSAAIQSLYEAKLLSSPYITSEEFEYLVANLTKYLGLVSKLKNRNRTTNRVYPNGLFYFCAILGIASVH